MFGSSPDKKGPKQQTPNEQKAKRSREKSASVRDIGPIPPIKDTRRRGRGRNDFKLFCQTYNPDAFSLEWSQDQDTSARMLEETVLHGALFANAEPRGCGKTTRARMAALWAISYGHWRYAFVIGANASKAEDTLGAIKTFIRYLPRYVEDFPEIAYPAIRLGGIAQRAHGQTCGEESTQIEWSESRIILPTVPPPSNWPKSWPLRRDGKVPTSGAIVGVSGLTGEGIRGSVITLTTGEQLRPDGVILDDPQTDESAASNSQTDQREQLISGAVLGMAGPGRTIAAIMALTVIRPNDLAARMLDREKHPLWRGIRMQLMASMPTNLSAWEPYFELYRQGAQQSPPDLTEATNYYRDHREELDEGAVASWPARKLPSELSAIQNAMNLYVRNPRAFFAEYQNDPQADPTPGHVATLPAETIMAKVNGIARQIVPLGATRTTAGIDVQHQALYYSVAAWADDFTGDVIDYGIWPDQGRPYVTYADLRLTLALHLRKVCEANNLPVPESVEACVYQGLQRLTEQILSREWIREDGAPMRVSRCLVDAGDGTTTDVVYQFCRQSKHAGILLPSHGLSARAGRDPYANHKKKPGERVGLGWMIPTIKGTRAIRHVLLDPNFWKTFIHSRLAVALGGRGCLALFGSNPDVHRMLADQLTSEVATKTENKATGRTFHEWSNPARNDNHLLDTLVYAAVAASIDGCALPETQGQQQTRPAGPKRKLSDIQAEKRRHRPGG